MNDTAELSHGIDPLMRRLTRIIKGKAQFEDKFIADHDELREAVKNLRKMGAKIIYTSGVWDLIHIGHGNYIHAGKEGLRNQFPEAEHWIMVVGVDSDDLTKQRKGPRRPIVPEQERLRMLAFLADVDIVTLQAGMRDALFAVRPDLLLLSSSTKDLAIEKYAEFKPHCGDFFVLPPQAETSTSAMVRNIFVDGVETLGKVFESQINDLAEDMKRRFREVIDTVRRSDR